MVLMSGNYNLRGQLLGSIMFVPYEFLVVGLLVQKFFPYQTKRQSARAPTCLTIGNLDSTDHLRMLAIAPLFLLLRCRAAFSAA